MPPKNGWVAHSIVLPPSLALACATLDSSSPHRAIIQTPPDVHWGSNSEFAAAIRLASVSSCSDVGFAEGDNPLSYQSRKKVSKYLRLFIALELPLKVQENLSLIQAESSKMLKEAKWASSQNIHLTLKFLGNTPDETVPKIKEKLAEAGKGVRPFHFKLGELGGFPSSKRARVFWLGVKEGEEKLIELQGLVEKALLPLGFEKEKRSFRPHLTLARFKIPQNLEETLSYLEKGDKTLNRLAEIPAAKITLFQSTLTPKGPVYTASAHFPLHSSPFKGEGKDGG